MKSSGLMSEREYMERAHARALARHEHMYSRFVNRVSVGGYSAAYVDRMTKLIRAARKELETGQGNGSND
jgi:hypothetical protein